MSEKESDLHRDCVNRFIALANAMKDEEIDIKVVNAGLMTAAGLYASYVIGGNNGGLTESGVEKVSTVFRDELARIQAIKKEAAGLQ
ncbi:MAG: DUF3144 domain-containing protein [Halioglobus sp.]|nr:DUF3144 domain-containing protein [Halioglobus sp.]